MLHILQLQQELEKESRRASQQQPHGSLLLFRGGTKGGVKTLLYKATHFLPTAGSFPAANA